MELKRINIKNFPLLFTFDYTDVRVEKCRELKSTYGYENIHYDKDLRGWLIQWKILEPLLKEFPACKYTERLVNEYKEVYEQKQNEIRNIKDSKLTELETDLPLFHYQKVGANFMVVNDKCMNNDDMGLGKTIQTIAVIDYLKLTNVLIVCPNNVRHQWKHQLKDWINKESIIVQKEIYEDGIHIINYEKLISCASFEEIEETDSKGKVKKKKTKLKLITDYFDHFQLVVFDESHYIKEGKTQRTKLALEICKLVTRVILLTGTPMLSKPRELIPQIKAVDKMVIFGSDWNFLNKYCDPKNNGFGMDYNGSSNLDDLQNKLELFSIRRLKRDVLRDLPDKMVNNVYWELIDPEAYMRLQEGAGSYLMNADEQFSLFYKSLAGKSQEERAEAIVNKDMSGMFKSMSAIVVVQIEKLKQEAARQKVIATREKFMEYIQNKTKVIVFCTHKETVNTMHEMYKQSVVISGDVSHANRMKAIEKFNTDPETLFLIATMQTTGVGLNLTVSSTVEFMELGWTPAEHVQCEDRAYRIGQENHVTVNYNIAVDSIDEDIIEVLNNKSAVIENTIRGKLLNKLILKILK